MLENHDEKRAATAFPSFAAHQAAAVVAFTVPGLRFFHDGQLAGRRVFHNMHVGPRAPEPEDAAVAAFYAQLLRLLKRPVLRDAGSWSRADVTESDDGNPSFRNIVAHMWTPHAEFDGDRLLAGGAAAAATAGHTAHLVVVNCTDGGASGHVHVSVPWAGGAPTPATFVDVMGAPSAAMTRDVGTEKGVWFGLEPYE